jgi:hypothetical protein
MRKGVSVGQTSSARPMAKLRLRWALLFLVILATRPVGVHGQNPGDFSVVRINSVCMIRSGSGSPEGAVTGNVCDVYLRTNGGTGTTIYIKESGTGNTGWAAPAASGTGAPTGATYITQTADGTLSAEQALALLSTGILKVTTTTGVVSSLAIPLTMANGGTDVASASDDQILVNSGSAWVPKTVPDCTDTGGNHLNYTQSTNALSCGTSGTGGGSLTVQEQDGTPSVSSVTTIKVTNGTLTDNGGGTVSVTTGGGGSGTAFSLMLRPSDDEAPSTAFATLDTRNGHPTLDFDGSTDEEAVFTQVLPAGYAGGGLTVDTFWSFTSATTGSLRVQAAIERVDTSSLDIDADSFASFNSAGGSAPGTSGQVIKVTITFTSGAQMDSLAAGELFRLKIRRDADGTSGTDDIATDAELLAVVVKET